MSNTKCTNCHFTSSEVRARYANDFEWTVPAFSDVVGEQLSSTFKRLGYTWQLKLIPDAPVRGRLLMQPGTGNIRMTLHLMKDSQPSSIKIAYTMSVINVQGSKLHQQSGVMKFTNMETKGYGFELISRANLFINQATLLPRNQLTVCCCILIPSDVIQSSYLMSMGQNFDQQKFGDVILKVGDDEIKAYKGVLASQSPVFASMFAHDFVENITNTVVIKDCEYQVLKTMIRFIYTDELPDDIDHDIVSKLLLVSHKYQMPKLQSLSQKKCCGLMSPLNACSTLILTKTLELPLLNTYTLDFLKNHWETVLKTEDFANFVRTYPAMLIESLKYINDGIKKANNIL